MFKIAAKHAVTHACFEENRMHWWWSYCGDAWLWLAFASALALVLLAMFVVWPSPPSAHAKADNDAAAASSSKKRKAVKSKGSSYDMALKFPEINGIMRRLVPESKLVEGQRRPFRALSFLMHVLPSAYAARHCSNAEASERVRARASPLDATHMAASRALYLHA